MFERRRLEMGTYELHMMDSKYISVTMRNNNLNYIKYIESKISNSVPHYTDEKTYNSMKVTDETNELIDRYLEAGEQPNPTLGQEFFLKFKKYLNHT